MAFSTCELMPATRTLMSTRAHMRHCVALTASVHCRPSIEILSEKKGRIVLNAIGCASSYSSGQKVD